MRDIFNKLPITGLEDGSMDKSQRGSLHNQQIQLKLMKRLWYGIELAAETRSSQCHNRLASRSLTLRRPLMSRTSRRLASRPNFVSGRSSSRKAIGNKDIPLVWQFVIASAMKLDRLLGHSWSLSTDQFNQRSHHRREIWTEMMSRKQVSAR